MKLWPFNKRDSRKVEAKGASSAYFTAGSYRAMELRYTAFAAEGYGQNPIAKACIDKIADAITGIDLKVMKSDGKGGVKTLPNHPMLKLINSPCMGMSGDQLIGAIVRYYLIAGNSYVLGTGFDAYSTPKPPLELYTLRPDSVTVKTDSEGRVIAYECSKAGGEKVTYPVNVVTGSSQVLHIKTFNPLNENLGLSPMVSAAFSVDVLNAGDQWNLSLLQNSARPSGALVVKNKDGSAAALSPEQKADLRTGLLEAMTGAQNSGRPLLLEGGLEWQAMGLTATDMDHERNMNNAARRIALAYGVPPMLLGIPGDNTYSNMAEARLALWTDTVLPLMDVILASLTNWLAPLYREEVFLWYDEDMIDALEPLRKSKADRVNAAQYMSANEKREAMGLDVIEGGNEVFIQSGMIPLSLAGDMGLSELGAQDAQG
jgi:HK97 family phage portal protein